MLCFFFQASLSKKISEYCVLFPQAALSRKISEYHRIGYIDDLIDIHFADAHCFKKRISEQDSQLEVTHHAG